MRSAGLPRSRGRRGTSAAFAFGSRSPGMQVAIPAAVRGAVSDGLLELLRLEVNVKEVEVVESDTDLVRLRPSPISARWGSGTASAPPPWRPRPALGARRVEAASSRGRPRPSSSMASRSPSCPKTSS